jgi:2,3-bisphosphoglycerate-dependent phosphoglycerate mutase
MIKLVLVRHGKSIWNLENKFTGWTDVDLCDEGIEEAKEAGKLLKEKGFSFDLAYTSNLKRAINTLDLILNEMNLNIEVRKNYKLNERHYGALQGLDKDETRKKYGDEQVYIWRRSYDVRPPLLTKDDPRYVEGEPLGESLKDTSERVIDYFVEEIKPELVNNKKIIIAAHGNSIRALIKYLDNLSDEDIMKIEIKTGSPIVYEFDDNLNVIRHYYLGDSND